MRIAMTLACQTPGERHSVPRPSTMLALVFLLLCSGPSVAGVVAVDSVGITVADLDRSVAFFGEVLGFEKTAEVEVTGEAYENLQGVFGVRMRVARLRLGDESIELTQYLAPEGRPVPVDSRSNDRWFQHIAIIVGDMDRAYAWLRQNKVRHASSGPQTLPNWNPNAGGIRAFYFKDPDGHALEILQFPPGKGASKWHQESDRLFLGIDHTAIVVADTEASLRFYRDALGFAVAGQSENHGTEQEHLNNVAGARLRITGLRAATGPGIELLQYLNPSDGRPLPADLRANDLAHWQTQVRVAEVDAASLEATGSNSVSRGVVSIPSAERGVRRAQLVRDPDGHAVELQM